MALQTGRPKCVLEESWVSGSYSASTLSEVTKVSDTEEVAHCRGLLIERDVGEVIFVYLLRQVDADSKEFRVSLSLFDLGQKRLKPLESLGVATDPNQFDTTKAVKSACLLAIPDVCDIKMQEKPQVSWTAESIIARDLPLKIEENGVTPI